MRGEEALSRTARFFLGCGGVLFACAVKAFFWIGAKVAGMAVGTPIPDVGGLYILAVTAAVVLFFFFVAAGGILSAALPDHGWLMALYHGATGPHMWLAFALYLGQGSH